MDLAPLVSIIIPIYNVESWVKNSLLSALKQSYYNIEYIVVDDCGMDNSMSIVESVVQEHHDKNIKIIRHTTNQGLSEARNTGLKASTGSYVFFMDSDDEISYNCIELHLNALRNTDADFSDGNVRMIGVGHNNFFTYNLESCFTNNDILIEYFNRLHVCGWNKLIKRDFLIDNNILFRKGMLYEDMLWTYQICKKAKKFVTVPSETYFYLIRQGSITTQNQDVNHAIRQFRSFVELLQCIRIEFQCPSNDELINLQSKWINKILLIVKTRLLEAPLRRNDKIMFFNETMSFTELTPSIFRLIHKLPYSIFSFLFYIPNKIFRKLR